MDGATIKMVNAQQAKLNNNYKNTKLKLLKTKPVSSCIPNDTHRKAHS